MARVAHQRLAVGRLLDVEPHHLGAVVRHVTGADYGGYLGGFAPNARDRALISGAIVPFLVPGLVLGAVWALRSKVRALRWTLLAFLGGGALLVAFVMYYGSPDSASYFVPALMGALLVTQPLVGGLARRVAPALIVALLAAATLTGVVVVVRETRAENARLEATDQLFHQAWHAIPFERGIVLWGDDRSSRLFVFQLLERDRPQLIAANPNMLTWSVARVAFARQTGTDPLAGLEIRTRQDVARIPENIRRQTALPVVEFPRMIELVRRSR